MAQRVSSTRSVAVERLAELDGVLLAALGRIDACRFDCHGFSGAGESGAAIFRTGIDAFQLEGREKIGRGIEIRQDKRIIFPGPFKISKPGEAIGRHETYKNERREESADGGRKATFAVSIRLFAHLPCCGAQAKRNTGFRGD